MTHICMLMRPWFGFPKVYQTTSVSSKRVKPPRCTWNLDRGPRHSSRWTRNSLLISINKCNHGSFTPVIGGVFFFDVYLYGIKYYTGMDSLWCFSHRKWGNYRKCTLTVYVWIGLKVLRFIYTKQTRTQNRHHLSLLEIRHHTESQQRWKKNFAFAFAFTQCKYTLRCTCVQWCTHRPPSPWRAGCQTADDPTPCLPTPHPERWNHLQKLRYKFTSKFTLQYYVKITLQKLRQHSRLKTCLKLR